MDITYINVDRNNLFDMQGDVKKQHEESCGQKEDKLSEKDWWDACLDFIMDKERILSTYFLCLVREERSGSLIAFNAHTLVGGKKTCAYLFVRRDYRKQGIATKMLQWSGITHANALDSALPFWKIWAGRNNCTINTQNNEMQPQ